MLLILPGEQFVRKSDFGRSCFSFYTNPVFKGKCCTWISTICLTTGSKYMKKLILTFMDVLTFLIKKALIKNHFSGNITIIFIYKTFDIIQYFLTIDYFCDFCVSMINIVHDAENGHTDGNPRSWAGQT